MQNDQLFGGKFLIMGGDFRQVLPVINGARATQAEACIKNLIYGNTSCCDTQRPKTYKGWFFKFIY